MTIEEIDVKTLKPYPNNPRDNKSAIDSVAESIRQFGFKQPIVIDAENVVVCGHTRLAAAKKLKLKTVPCVRADDLTPDQTRAYRLLDNKLAEKSDWDFEKLEIELDEIDFDFEPFDVSFDSTDDENDDLEPKGDGRIFQDKQETPEIFGVYISFETESEQEEFYDEMKTRGLECRLTNI